MKKPQTERAMRRRASKARRSVTLCAKHAARLKYGTPDAWHVFRCGCESPAR